MRIILLCVTLTLSLALSASMATPSIRESVQALLPKELSQLSFNEKAKELKRKFSSKLLKDKDKSSLHLAYFSKVNDVTIGLKPGQGIEYLYVEASQEMQRKSKFLFQEAVEKLSQEEKDKLAREVQGEGHDAGRFITIKLPKESLQLKFYNNEKKDLHSLIVYPPQKSSP